MKKRKKCLSLLLALALVFSLLPISAFAETGSYGIAVGGVAITSANKGNVTGFGISGKVSYDPDKNILTLNGATITGVTHVDKLATIGISTSNDLIIELKGVNTIKFEDEYFSKSGILAYGQDEETGEWVKKNLSIIGDGELRIDAGNVTGEDSFSVGIRANNLSMYGATVSASAGTAPEKRSAGVLLDEKLVMENGTLTAKGEGQAIYAPDWGIYTEKKVTVAKDITSPLTSWSESLGEASLFAAESSYKQVKIAPATKLYPIWVGDTQVSESNKGDVLGTNDKGASVTFDGAHTLTLNNAAIDMEDWPYGIWSDIPLTIKLVGDNTITWQSNNGGVSGIVIKNTARDERLDLTFEGSGNLTITVPNTKSEYNSGITANNLTVNSTGTITIDSGEAKEDTTAIVLWGNYVQGKGKVEAWGRNSKISNGIWINEGGKMTLNGASTFHAGGTTKALDVPAITVNSTDPSIIADELYKSTDKSVKIEAGNVEKLIGDNPVYKSVYITSESKPASDSEVQFTIASSVMKKGDENVEMGAAPFIQGGRTMIPLRYVAEALGLEVSWDVKTKTVTLNNEKSRIVVPTDSLTMKVNEKNVASDVLPVLQGGRVYLSISNIGKALGLENGKDIQWNPKDKTVIIMVP